MTTNDTFVGDVSKKSSRDNPPDTRFHVPETSGTTTYASTPQDSRPASPTIVVTDVRFFYTPKEAFRIACKFSDPGVRLERMRDCITLPIADRIALKGLEDADANMADAEDAEKVAWVKDLAFAGLAVQRRITREFEALLDEVNGAPSPSPWLQELVQVVAEAKAKLAQAQERCQQLMHDIVAKQAERRAQGALHTMAFHVNELQGAVAKIEFSKSSPEGYAALEKARSHHHEAVKDGLAALAHTRELKEASSADGKIPIRFDLKIEKIRKEHAHLLRLAHEWVGHAQRAYDQYLLSRGIGHNGHLPFQAGGGL